MKRYLSLFLCVTLLLSLSLDIVSVRAVETPTIICENVSCEAGKQITVDVTISNNPGFAYLEVTPTYPSELIFVKATNGELVSDFTKGKQYVWVADEDVTTDGLLMTFTFDIAETVSAGEYSVGFVVRTCANYSEEPVQFSVESGTITVKAKPVSVTGVSLNKNTLSLETGEEEMLVATITPDNATNKAVAWMSNDNKIATVDNAGKVTAVKEGTTTITVTTEDGSYSASCAVSVACNHTNKVETPSKSPDCVNPGNNKYYTCSACGDVFKADGVTETTVKAETIAALNHDFTEKIEDAAHLVPGSGTNCQQAKHYYYDCSRCNVMGSTSWTSTSVGNHKMETTWTTENGKHFHKCSVTGCTYTENQANCSGGTATCTAKAVCSVCQKEYGDLLNHDLTHHARNEADHFRPGNIEYWTCDACDEYFGDSSAETEIEEAEIKIAQIPHSHGTAWEKNNAQHWNECSCGDKINVYDHNYDNTCDTTCNTCGYTRTTTHTWNTTLSYNATQHWTECSVCGEKKDVEVHIGGTADCQNKAVCTDCQQPYGELTGCDFTAEKAEDKYLKSAATCKDVAVYNKSCTICGKSGENTFIYGTVDANNHIETELRNQMSVSCTNNGYTGDTYCKDCGEKVATGSAILAGHKLDKVIANPATHDADGNIEHYTCSVCKKLFNDDKATKELTEAEVVIAKGEHSYSETFQHDENGHWKGCECGSKIEEGAHTFGEWVVTTKADVGVEGSKERTCTICGYKQTEKLPATTTPATGDNTHIGFLFILMLISACGMITMLFIVPRKKGKYQR